MYTFAPRPLPCNVWLVQIIQLHSLMLTCVFASVHIIFLFITICPYECVVIIQSSITSVYSCLCDDGAFFRSLVIALVFLPGFHYLQPSIGYVKERNLQQTSQTVSRVIQNTCNVHVICSAYSTVISNFPFLSLFLYLSLFIYFIFVFQISTIPKDSQEDSTNFCGVCYRDIMQSIVD